MTDEQLVNAALEKTKPLGSVRAAEALKVSRQTYARWKRGEVGALLAQNRAHLERIVAAPEDRGPAYADGYAAALDDVRKAVDLLAKSPAAEDVPEQIRLARKATGGPSPDRPAKGARAPKARRRQG